MYGFIILKRQKKNFDVTFFKDDDEFDVPKNEFEIDEEDVEIESVDDFEDVGTNQEGITLGDTLMDPVEDEFDDEEFENMPGNTI